MKYLLTDSELEASEIVANCLMNRQRQLIGSNSYTKELGLNPLSFITNRIQNQSNVAWLDICCGTGRALIHAAEFFYQLELVSRTSLIGVDIVSEVNLSTLKCTLCLCGKKLYDCTGETPVLQFNNFR